MLKAISRSLKLLGLVVFVILFRDNVAMSQVTFTPSEKIVIEMGKNTGETSYLLSDVIYNTSVIGTEKAIQESDRLGNLANQENQREKENKLDKKLIFLSNKFLLTLKSTEDKTIKFDSSKLAKAQEVFSNYSKELRSEIKRIYGEKAEWLFDTVAVAEFTHISMQAEYKNKLLLPNFVYLLEYIPYKLPTSIAVALTNILAVTTTDELSQYQVEFLDESAKSIITYFSDPDNYVPAVTLKDLVGTWKGRLADPDGNYHTATLMINPDLSAKLTAENLFNNISVKTINLNESIINFQVEPFGNKNMQINFTGKLNDNMIAGEAVDMTGKKGLWQLLKVSTPLEDAPPVSMFKNEPGSLDKYLGVWKGKILEASGAISNATLIFNLDQDSKLIIENNGNTKELSISKLAVNDEAIKFDVNSPPKNIGITFYGKLKSDLLEGNAKASDGSRGYWKLKKVIGADKKAYNTDNSWLTSSEYPLYDPVIDSKYFNPLIFVVNTSDNICPTFKNEYKGYLNFSNGEKLEFKLILNDQDSKLLLIDSTTKNEIDLPLQELKISDRDIFFKTSLVPDSQQTVEFNGTIFGNYIQGEAINNSDERIKWEAISSSAYSTLMDKCKSNDLSKIYGNWQGIGEFIGLFDIPINLTLSKTSKTLQLSNKEILKVKDLLVEGNNITLTFAKDTGEISPFQFYGFVEGGKLKGKLRMAEGQNIDVQLSQLNNQAPTVLPIPKQDLDGIWLGKVTMSQANADVVFDFTQPVKKIYIDDPNAEKGRLNLTVKNLVQKDNKITFKATTPKSPIDIDFVGINKGQRIDGYLKNQLDISKKLTVFVSKSDLMTYIPDSNNNHSTGTETANIGQTFSFLDEMNPKEDKTVDKSITTNTETVAANTATTATQNTQKAKTDTDTKANTVDEAQKQLNEIIKKSEDIKSQIANASNVASNKTDNTNKASETSNANGDELASSSPTTSSDAVAKDVDSKDFLGKWIGEVITPQSKKGEVIIEIKKDDSFMYIDKDGEKVLFKLFDFRIDGKNITFKIKPSPDSEYGIVFKGAMIEGVLSGIAIDPSGGEGKWHALRP